MENNENSKDQVKNYNLSSEAVESLASADTDPIPQYSEEELYKYRKKKFHIPDWLKVVFIKFWFAGAVCFFISWGLPIGGLDQLFVLSMVLGMVTDLLTNNVIRFIEPLPGANDKWLVVKSKGMVGLGLNLLLGVVVILAVYVLYFLIYSAVMAVTKSDSVVFGVEPLLFGLLCMGVDMLFVGIKMLISSILRDAREAAKGKDLAD